MLVPKVTLQGEVGDTRSFVVDGKFVHFRALVPRTTTNKLATRLKKMKRVDGLPLFKIQEVAAKSGSGKDPVIVNAPVTQHVDGEAEKVGLKNKRFTR